MIFKFLKGSKLATQFIQNNGLFVITGGEKPFFTQTPNNTVEALIQTQTHFLAMNLAHRNEEEIPVDVTITTFLRGNDLEQQTEQKKIKDAVVGLLKKWADGKARPHDGSYFVMKTKEGKVFPEYV